MEHLSLYRGSGREIWREGCCNEDSETHGMEGSGHGKCLSQGFIRGT